MCPRLRKRIDFEGYSTGPMGPETSPHGVRSHRHIALLFTALRAVINVSPFWSHVVRFTKTVYPCALISWAICT